MENTQSSKETDLPPMTQEKEEEERQKQLLIRVIAVIWIVGGVLATVLGLFNFIIVGILARGGMVNKSVTDFAALFGGFLIIFGGGAVLVGFGLLKLNYYAWIVFEIQTGLGALISLFFHLFGQHQGKAFAFFRYTQLGIIVAPGCLVLLALTFPLRNQFRTKT